MERGLWRRTLVLVGIVVACVATFVPTFVGREALPSWYPITSRINLGLDLEGGSHVVYNIDLDKAIDDRAAEIKRDLEARFADDRITATVKTPASPVGAVTIVPGAAHRDAESIAARVRTDYGDTVERLDCPASDGANAICFRVSTKYAESVKRAALATAVATIRERIDEKGVAEPSVVEKGDQIIVELPGLDQQLIDETRALIARTAKLEFKVVDDGSAYMRRVFAHVGSEGKEGKPTDPRAIRDGIYADIDMWRPDDGDSSHTDYFLYARDRELSLPVDEARALDCPVRGRPVVDGKVECDVAGRHVIQEYLDDLAAADPSFAIPDDREIGYELIEPEPGAKDSRRFWRSYYLDRSVRLTGTSIANAMGSYDPNTNRPIVLLDFNRFGSRVFGDLTAQIVGKKLATILDGKVKSAPIINQAIRGGRASITMGGSDNVRQEQERDELVSVLRTGSLPAPLREESVAQVGPTLGHDAVEKAQLAFGLGIVLVIVLMVGIYQTSGAIALITLCLNVLFVLTLLVVFDATLTLPGIAGIVLAFGMSVDGNIIIFERIREELARKKSLRGAVDTGFSRAFSAIFDGQLTTMAGGFVLLQYGTGPITGFAVTLIMGNVTALFANIWCTRVIYDHYLAHLRKRGKPLAI